MRLLNPMYVEKVSDLATIKAQIDTYFENNKLTKFVTFDQLRTFFGKTEQQWPDGVIHQQLIDWGYTVEA